MYKVKTIEGPFFSFPSPVLPVFRALHSFSVPLQALRVLMFFVKLATFPPFYLDVKNSSHGELGSFPSAVLHVHTHRNGEFSETTFTPENNPAKSEAKSIREKTMKLLLSALSKELPCLFLLTIG